MTYFTFKEAAFLLTLLFFFYCMQNNHEFSFVLLINTGYINDVHIL